MTDISDGTSNTILLLEVPASRAVIWTKPDDLAFDPEQPSQGLESRSGDGYRIVGAGRTRSILPAGPARLRPVRNSGLSRW